MNRGQYREEFQIDKEEIHKIIKGDTERLVNFAQKIGYYLAQRKLSTSQIRNIFSEIKKMQTKYDRNRLLLLKPRLAYAAGRHGEAVKTLKEILTIAIDNVENERDFYQFVNFFEAILAYHREKGGRTS